MAITPRGPETADYDLSMRLRPLDVAAKGVLAVLARLPEPAQLRIAGELQEVDGQTVHPEVGMALRLLHLRPGPTFESLPLDQGRRQLDTEAWVFGRRTRVGRVEELVIPTAAGPLPARRYDPHADRAGDAVLVYFHGGGWVLGGLESADTVCRYLTVRAGLTVVSVDYRLAPEHPFPAASDDALAAYRFVLDVAPSWGVPADRVMVSGDSAGGTLTVVTALRARDEGLPAPRLQVMFFPAADAVNRRPSREKYGTGYFLTSAQVDWYYERYLPNPADRGHPWVSPLLAPSLAAVGPCYVGVAGFDPLRDEGIALAQRLRAEGNEVTLDIDARHVHGYVNATGVGRTSSAALDRAVAAMRAALR